MKILYIVSMPLEINSSASLRNITTINGLSQLGNEVIVVTGHPDKNHPQYSFVELNKGIKQLYTSENFAKTTSAKMSHYFLLRKIKLLIYKFYSSKNVYDSYKYVANDSIWDELSCENFDVVISSADPKSSHLVAEKIVDKYDLPWIQIWGDPFTGDITSIGKLENKKKIEEKRFLQKATKVFYLSELTCEEMKEKYSEYADKLFFMPRPYNEPKLYEPMQQKETLTLSYCGDYNDSVRNIKPLYRAVCESGDYLTICGNGNVSLQASEKIKINGRVSQDKVCEIEDEADILVHLSNLSGTQIPGKIYNYSATNKPILFILDGDCERIKNCFAKYNRYVFCQNNSEDIKRSIDLIRKGQTVVAQRPVEAFSMEMALANLLI